MPPHRHGLSVPEQPDDEQAAAGCGRGAAGTPLQSRVLGFTMTKTLDATSSKSTRAKQRSPATKAKQSALPEVAHATEKQIRTVLVAAHGWPTEDMQATKRPGKR